MPVVLKLRTLFYTPPTFDHIPCPQENENPKFPHVSSRIFGQISQDNLLKVIECMTYKINQQNLTKSYCFGALFCVCNYLHPFGKLLMKFCLIKQNYAWNKGGIFNKVPTKSSPLLNFVLNWIVGKSFHQMQTHA